MLWSPFVGHLTRELQKFHDAFVTGKRPRLALLTPPQHGKSWAAEDFCAWVVGKHPEFKTIYSSFSADLGVLRNMNLQRLFTSRPYHHIFPNFKIGGTGTSYQCNASLIEYVGGPGSFRNTTVNGPITGMEQHLGVLDDFVKGRAEANSKLHRDRTWNWFTDEFALQQGQRHAGDLNAMARRRPAREIDAEIPGNACGIVSSHCRRG
jgi:hypothetical protein